MAHSGRNGERGANPLVRPSGVRHANPRQRRRHHMRFLGIDLDLLTPAERRDLANALLRAAWSAALEDTRILLLDLLLEVDDAAIGGGR